MHDDRRCFQGDRCPLREPVRAGDQTATGEWQAPLLSHPDEVLCPACRARLHEALTRLPSLMPLSVGRHVTFEIRYKELSVTIPRSPFRPVPIDLELDALLRLVEHETTSWAEMLSDSRDTPTAAADSPASMTLHDRVAGACQTLDLGVDAWLTMTPQVYRARSLGIQRGLGHAGEHLTYDGRDLWTERDGATAALVIMGLHERACQQLAGGPLREREKEPCWVRECRMRTVFRVHEENRVVCETCNATRSDDSWDEYRDEYADQCNNAFLAAAYAHRRQAAVIPIAPAVPAASAA
jgi:hypothetical protein